MSYLNKGDNKIKEQPNIDHLNIGGFRESIGHTDEPEMK